ncbi:MAG: hypothetical protein LUI60_05555 [Clostridia bacterium]|nr:hypothetical protein [Clostridia bacterium]
MKKLLALFKKKDGAALVTAMMFMIMAVALCGIISTYVIMMAKTSSNYSTVNENKIVADKIASDYLYSLNNSSTFDGDSYDGYTVSDSYNDTDDIYTLYVYEDGDTSPVVTVIIEKDTGGYQYTKYEYGNI